jgi:xanthine dehydrogenase molybdopterin-binding subunit B
VRALHPLEQRHRLAGAAAGGGQRPRRLEHPSTHGAPIVDRDPDIGEAGLQRSLQASAVARIELRVDLVQDCGRSLNPTIDRGQIEGAFVQGQGWLTCEELYWDDQGRQRTLGPSTYKIPGSRDVPPDFRVRLLAAAPARQDTIFRSKAVGEPPLMLANAAWLAIKDACAAAAGTRHVRLDAPATPEAILRACGRLPAR